MLCDAACFAAMAKDGIAKRQRRAVMHQQRPRTHAPQRSGAHSVGGRLKGIERKISPLSLVHTLAIVLLYGHDDTVPSADVVQQEVTVRVKTLAPERFWNREFPAIDASVPGAAVVNVGTWQMLQPILANSASPALAAEAPRLLRVARRGFGGAYETREAIDVGKTVCARPVVWFCNRVAQVRHFIREEAIRNSYFI